LQEGQNLCLAPKSVPNNYEVLTINIVAKAGPHVFRTICARTAGTVLVIMIRQALSSGWYGR